MMGMGTLSIYKVACTVYSSYVPLCDLDALSLGWLLWIGRFDSSGTTLLTTALRCLHTMSRVGIHGNIVDLEHLVWYKHLIAIGQLRWLKRY
jgi:hypothetical protein